MPRRIALVTMALACSMVIVYAQDAGDGSDISFDSSSYVDNGCNSAFCDSLPSQVIDMSGLTGVSQNFVNNNFIPAQLQLVDNSQSGASLQNTFQAALSAVVQAPGDMLDASVAIAQKLAEGIVQDPVASLAKLGGAGLGLALAFSFDPFALTSEFIADESLGAGIALTSDALSNTLPLGMLSDAAGGLSVDFSAWGYSNAGPIAYNTLSLLNAGNEVMEAGAAGPQIIQTFTAPVIDLSTQAGSGIALPDFPTGNDNPIAGLQAPVNNAPLNVIPDVTFGTGPAGNYNALDASGNYINFNPGNQNSVDNSLQDQILMAGMVSGLGRATPQVSQIASGLQPAIQGSWLLTTLSSNCEQDGIEFANPGVIQIARTGPNTFSAGSGSLWGAAGITQITPGTYVERSTYRNFLYNTTFALTNNNTLRVNETIYYSSALSTFACTAQGMLQRTDQSSTNSASSRPANSSKSPQAQGSSNVQVASRRAALPKSGGHVGTTSTAITGNFNKSSEPIKGVAVGGRATLATLHDVRNDRIGGRTAQLGGTKSQVAYNSPATGFRATGGTAKASKSSATRPASNPPPLRKSRPASSPSGTFQTMISRVPGQGYVSVPMYVPPRLTFTPLPTPTFVRPEPMPTFVRPEPILRSAPIIPTYIPPPPMRVLKAVPMEISEPRVSNSQEVPTTQRAPLPTFHPVPTPTYRPPPPAPKPPPPPPHR